MQSCYVLADFSGGFTFSSETDKVAGFISFTKKQTNGRDIGVMLSQQLVS